MLSVQVKGDPSATDATEAVRQLRSEFIPEAFAGTEAEVFVGGTSSENIDYFDSVIDPAPYVLAFVLLLTFVLLTVVFRSVVVAGTAVLLNLLSVAAAYGLLVLVFEEGRRQPPRLPDGGHDRGLGAALPLLCPVWALHGLPGVPAQPHP